MRPYLWVFAGPNGSGKSTVVKKCFKDKLPVVNPDDIVAKLSPSNLNDVNVQLKASKIAIKERNSYLQDNRSFALETTLSGNSEINLIKLAKNKGFKVNVVYISTQDPMDNIIRVAHRVKLGGHNVSAEDIIRRYERSLINLKSLIGAADHIFVLDNSTYKPRYCLRVDNSSIKVIIKDFPEWVALLL